MLDFKYNLNYAKQKSALYFFQMDKLVDDLLEESIRVYKETGPIGDSSKALWQFITEVSFMLACF